MPKAYWAKDHNTTVEKLTIHMLEVFRAENDYVTVSRSSSLAAKVTLEPLATTGRFFSFTFL